MTITPAILPENFEQIIDKLFRLEGLVTRVQIDICDGVFGLEKTWLPYRETELPLEFTYEFDLMVCDWRKYLPRVIALGAKRVVMHIDTFNEDDINEMLTIARRHKISLGLSVSNDKDMHAFARRVRAIEAHYSKIFIQVMGIKHIGAQGQPFDESVLARIGYLADACRHIHIQVDGSMNPETILMVKNRGATCAVVGSYLFNHGTVKKNLEKLENNFK